MKSIVSKSPEKSFLANLLERKSNERAIKNPIQHIYTTGYTGKLIDQLPALLEHLDAVLIDIRFVPFDKQIQWKRDYLRLLLKDKYQHVSHLGNRASESSGKPVIHNLELGIKILFNLKMNVLLMCECRDTETCHRFLISHKLKEQGIETSEITDWKISA